MTQTPGSDQTVSNRVDASEPRTGSPHSPHSPHSHQDVSFDDPIDRLRSRHAGPGPAAVPRLGGRTGFLMVLGFSTAGLAAVLGVVFGVMAMEGAVDGQVLLGASVFALLGLMVLFPVAVAVQGQRRAIDTMARTQAEMALAVRTLAEQAALSDDARRVLNRRPERALLRRAIEEDIEVEDWDAAAVLCAELADQFGYRADAEELRRQIDRARHRTVERDVAVAVAEMDTMLLQHNWAEAAVAAIRIGRLYPESPSVEGLRHRVQRARSAYREELERRFRMAVDEDRPEDALDLLEELDQYLTEAQAAPLMDTARGVIGKAKEMLGARFKAAVHEQNMDEAVAIGDRIMARFPNSRMSHEVADILTTMQQRTPG